MKNCIHKFIKKNNIFVCVMCIFIIIVFITFCVTNVEHQQGKSKGPKGPKSINFENKTDKTIYYIFTYPKKWHNEKNKWTFNILDENNTNTQPAASLNNITTPNLEVYQIESKKTLSIQPTNINDTNSRDN